MRRVPWSPPALEKEEQEAAIRVIKSGWMTQGKETEAFEKEIAYYIETKHAIVVNNGTAALITSLIASGIGKDDEVIVPSLTFIASINAIMAVGAEPVLVDSDVNTFNITPEIVRDKITNKTKAIMAVDVAGMPVDLDSFQDLAKKRRLILIEDAAEAAGAEYKNKKVGSFNHLTILSFHMAKTLTTIEGGCILTNDDKLARVCRMVRNHGMQARYDYACFGLNFRITDVQSAIGRAQLRKLNYYLDKRNEFAERYKKSLQNVKFQQIPNYVTKHPWMLFGVLVDKRIRNDLVRYLNKNGVDTRVCWLPTHKQVYHSKIFSNIALPNSEEIASKIINLPMGNGLIKEDVDYVINVFNNFF